MKITNIKKTKNKYQITFDNGEIIKTNDHVIVNSNLLYKKNLSNKELANLKEENE